MTDATPRSLLIAVAGQGAENLFSPSQSPVTAKRSPLIPDAPLCDGVNLRALGADDPARRLLEAGGELDGLLLLVAAEEGVTPLLAELALLAGELGLPLRVAVCADEQPQGEWKELLSEELQALGFHPAAQAHEPVFLGASVREGLSSLVALLEGLPALVRPPCERADGSSRPFPSRRLDLRVSLPAHAAQPLTHHQRVRVFLGEGESLGKVVMLGDDSCAPGGRTLLQVLLDGTLAARRGDLLLLRPPHGGRCQATARVLDPCPPLHRRRRPALLKRLEELDGSPEQAVRACLQLLPFGRLEALARRINLPVQTVETLLAGLVAGGEAFLCHQEGVPLWCVAAHGSTIQQRALETLQGFHAAHPQEDGMSRSAFWQAMGDLVPAPVRAAVAGMLAREGFLRHLDNSRLALSPERRESLGADGTGGPDDKEDTR